MKPAEILEKAVRKEIQDIVDDILNGAKRLSALMQEMNVTEKKNRKK